MRRAKNFINIFLIYCQHDCYLYLTVIFQTHLKGAKTSTNPQKIGKTLRYKASVGMSKVVPTHASSSAGSPTMARRRKTQLKVQIFLKAMTEKMTHKIF